MTEDQAKTKWCPMVRRSMFTYGSHDISVNRDGQNDKCLASECAMWRWNITTDPIFDEKVQSRNNGFCGLGGKP